MSITARKAYNPNYGKIKVGRCLKCKDSVYNYRYGRFRILIVYQNGRSIGYCHQACYEKWNPRIGHCISCGKSLRQRGNYRRTSRGIYCISCFREAEKEQEQREQERIETIKRNVIPIIKNTVRITAQFVPLGREIYLCYSTARFLYSSWNAIYSAYQNPNATRLEQETYSVIRSGARIGLTTVQTNFIWNKIENDVPEDLKYEAKNTLTKIMSEVSEEEISIVENALRYF